MLNASKENINFYIHDMRGTPLQKYGPSPETLKREEEFIISQNSLCPSSDIEKYSITEEQVRNAIISFPSASILHALLCFNNLKPRIGRLSLVSDGKEGVVMKTDNNLFILKTGRNNFIIHEYFIGAFCLNHLRRFIPNFAYILGIFYCEAPYRAGRLGKRILVSYCTDPKPFISREGSTLHIMYENILDAVTFHDFAGVCTDEIYLNILQQIAFSIRLAFRKFKFTHYDLHARNVMIKKLSNPIIIRYDKYFIKTSYIATIIDYGRSYVEYKGESYGYDYKWMFTYSDRHFPLGDLYLFLISSLISLHIGRKEKDPLGKYISLVKFFSPHETSVIEYISKIEKIDYVLPYERDTEFLLDEYLDLLINLSPSTIMSAATPEATLYGCHWNKSCEEVKEIIARITGGGNYSSVDYFLNLYSQEPNQNLIEMGSVHSENYMKTLIDRRDKLISYLNPHSRNVFETIRIMKEIKKIEKNMSLLAKLYNLQTPQFTDYTEANNMIIGMRQVFNGIEIPEI